MRRSCAASSVACVGWLGGTPTRAGGEGGRKGEGGLAQERKGFGGWGSGWAGVLEAEHNAEDKNEGVAQKKGAEAGLQRGRTGKGNGVGFSGHQGEPAGSRGSQPGWPGASLDASRAEKVCAMACRSFGARTGMAAWSSARAAAGSGAAAPTAEWRRKSRSERQAVWPARSGLGGAGELHGLSGDATQRLTLLAALEGLLFQEEAAQASGEGIGAEDRVEACSKSEQGGALIGRKGGSVVLKKGQKSGGADWYGQGWDSG